MPIIKSAKKAARQTEKRTKHNVALKKSIKSALKLFRSQPTFENFKKAQSEYDKAVKKDLMKKNTASRRKSALAKIAKSAGMKFAKSAKNTTKPTPKTKPTTAKKPTTPKSTPKKSAPKTSTNSASKTTN